MIKKKTTLEQRINRLELAFRLKNEAAAPAGAESVYQDDLWDVYRVTTYAAAKQLGRGTDWGIAGKWDKDSYATNGVWSGEEFFNKQMQRFSGGIYIYVKKKSKDKYYALCKPNGSVAVIGDNDEYSIKPGNILLEEPDFPSIEGVFVPKKPSKKAQGTAALINAIAKGDKAKVAEFIAQGVDLNKPDQNKAYPLVVAISNKQYEIAKMLLEAGADPNSDPAGRRAMSAAVGEKKVNRDARFVDLLVEYRSTLPQVW
jgi:hypothetical protein